MKKFLAILLSILMIFSMTACANDTPDTTNPDSSIESTIPDDSVTSDPSEDETAVEEVVFNPVTLVDNEHIIFKVTSEPYRDEFWDGYTINVYAENPTDTTFYVSLLETSVNDYMIDPYFTEQVAAGKKLNSNFTFMKADLDLAGITKSIDKISFKVGVYDENWSELYISDEVSITFEKE